MTVAQRADKIRRLCKSLMYISTADVARLLGCDHKTAERKVAHLPRFNDDGFVRYDITDIAEWMETNMERKQG